MDSKNTENDIKNKGYYNRVEFLSIISIIVFQTILDFFIGAEFYLINAIISFSIVYMIKLFIDRAYNFHNKWNKYKEDNFFYVLYSLIAFGSGIIYVGVQYVLKYDILYPILAGGTVLTIKKILDQEYGLFFKERMKELILYGFFAIFTTIIFWGVQYILTIILGESYYIIAGAVGLAIGYTVKFVLDKIYVFKKKFGSSSQQTMFYVLYIIFGFISSVINLGTQWFLGYYYLGGYHIFGVLAGTVVGFVVKYILDKFIIFRKRNKN
ncbi:MAG: GtrA family protein [Candidatus Helarchaeota archaeon]